MIEKNGINYLGILAILFWASTIAFTRSLTESLGTITAGALVFMLSTLFAILYLLKTSPQSLRDILYLPRRYLLGCGALFVIYMTSLYLAIGLSNSRQQVVEISILNYLWPGLTLLLSIPILQKKARISIILGVLLGFGGALIAFNPYQDFSFGRFYQNIQQNWIPVVLALIAAFSWSLYSVFARKWASHVKESAVPIFLCFTGLILIFLRLFFKEQAIWNLTVVGELLYMSIFPTFLAYFFWDKAVRKGNIVFIATLSYFIPILSVFISSIYLQIAIKTQLWVAAVLVVIGALVSRYSILEK